LEQFGLVFSRGPELFSLGARIHRAVTQVTDEKHLRPYAMSTERWERVQQIYAAAVECDRKMRRNRAGQPPPLPQAFHLTSIAHIYLQQGRIEEALSTYRRAVELSQRARHADGQARSMRALGDVLFGLGRDEEALPYVRQAAQLFAQLEDCDAEAEMVARTATILERLASPAEAADAWQTVASLRRAQGDAKGELAALEGLARTGRQRTVSPEDAIPAFHAGLTLATTLGDRPREVALHNTLGILEFQRERYLDALRHYEAALRLVRDRGGDRAHEGLLLNSLGVTLNRLHRHDEARTALEESVARNRESGERLLEAHALAALGDVWRAGGRSETAAACFEPSLSLRRVLGDRRGEGWMLLRLAEILAAKGDPSQARASATEAMAIAEAIGDESLVAACTPIAHTVRVGVEEES
jgi:tetratricopeptide (TPR) repeat protein